jgi:hypothetical protein
MTHGARGHGLDRLRQGRCAIDIEQVDVTAEKPPTWPWLVLYAATIHRPGDPLRGSRVRR